VIGKHQIKERESVVPFLSPSFSEFLIVFHWSFVSFLLTSIDLRFCSFGFVPLVLLFCLLLFQPPLGICLLLFPLPPVFCSILPTFYLIVPALSKVPLVLCPFAFVLPLHPFLFAPLISLLLLDLLYNFSLLRFYPLGNFLPLIGLS